MTSAPRADAQARPILVVDDDPLLCEFVAMALADQGFRTLVAGDGLQALEFAAADPPALLLVDVGIPHLSGRELALRVRERCAEPIPCILMSGSILSRSDGDGSAVVGCLPKPFELDDLFTLVRRYALTVRPAATP